tara:strand:- start:451 stop:1236 length:786 start_codon:yes stop_codon:yes gene_type:complete
MNLFTGRTALTVFVVIGVLAMAGGLILSILLSGDPDQGDITDLPTAEAVGGTTDAEAQKVEEVEGEDQSVEIVRNFQFAEFVIDAEAENYIATIATAKGSIVIELFVDVAPMTVNSFIFLAENHFFDGLTFHRVVDNFVVQGGDPSGTGRGGPGYSTNDEPNDIRNETGTIAMAKGAGQTVFGSQFFINLKDNPALDFDAGNRDKFYPFGRVIEGMDVINALEQGDVMESVTIVRVPRSETDGSEEDVAENSEGDGSAGED